MALANTAWILADHGHNVLVADWAIGAQRPSVDQYLAGFFPSEEIPDEQPGIFDVVRDYWDVARHDSARDSDLGALWERHGRIGGHILTLGWSPAGLDSGLAGKLAYLGPGRRSDDGYWAETESFDWKLFVESRPGRHFLASLRTELAESGYDYVLLDSLSGRPTVTQHGVTHLADVLVACFKLGYAQEIKIAAELTRTLRRLTERRPEGPVRVLPVPMWDDRNTLDGMKRFARNRFDPLLQVPGEGERARYWANVTVPESPYFRRHPIIAAIAEDPAQPGTALKAYEALAQAITGDPATKAKARPEPDRMALKRSLTAQPAAAMQDVAILSCVADGPWADWITWVLRSARVRVRPYGTPGSPVETTIVLLSPDLAEAPEFDEAWPLIADLKAGSRARDDKRLIGVRVREGALHESLALAVDVDLVPHGADAAAVRRKLLTTFTWLDQLEPRDVDAPDAPRFPKRPPRVREVSAPAKNFVGRDGLLRDLRDALVRDRGTGRPTVLTGTTAIGKSSVAAMYAWLYAHDYDVIWWIPAEDAHQVRTKLAELLPRLREGAPTDAHDAVDQVRRALAAGDGPDRWLLIYDGADDPRGLDELMPTGGPGNVLVTSRHEGWASAGHTVLPVGRFERAESIRLFLSRIGDSDIPRVLADRVAERLHDQPLAIDQAAGWVATTWSAAQSQEDPPTDRTPRTLVDEYLDKLGGRDEITVPAGEERPVELSLDRLAGERAAGLWLLRVCAYLSPDGVAMELVRSAGMREEVGRHDPALGLDVTVDEVVQTLKRYSLIRVDQQLGRLCVHPHTLRIVRDRMTAEERHTARASAQAVLAAAVPGDEASGALRERRHRELQRHVAACELGDTVKAADPVRAWAVRQVRHLYLTNDWQVAADLADQLRARWTDDFAEGDRYRLELLVELANALRELGDYAQAAHWDEEAGRLREEHLPANHLLGLKIRRAAGADLRTQGRFGEAARLDERTLDEFRRRLGEEHPDTLREANNLAVSFRLTGAIEAALEQDRSIYETRRRVLGEQAPETWHTLVMLSIDYRELGDYANAVSHLEEVLGELRSSGRDNTPAALRAEQALAVTRRYAGQAEEVLESLTGTWHRSREFYGPRHPATLSCAVSVAATQAASGRTADALDRGRLNLRFYREGFGESHPFTRACEANLSVYARLCGQLAEALPYAEKAWRALHEDVNVGPKHPFTLAAEIGYANALAAVGRADAACEHERHAYAGYSERLGERHPLSQIAYTNLQVTEDAKTGADTGLDSGLRRDIDIEIPST
ncbi:Tetratricopeptide repeat-containing protein [Actinomadura meyerae]|uniref:Tetratricopeptide repeat-containing protein n=1 Tax=Actinomadura meyerae TaxID=240840 RepID=A0A239NGI3_9ACTN|nr:FxSxx-COOH system tetratricopeptide repeat protein [Actinomadura meyerae]SNT54001.1 Tetratricopeptide repeat-containing protein [Actinomadura meyerae]